MQDMRKTYEPTFYGVIKKRTASDIIRAVLWKKTIESGGVIYIIHRNPCKVLFVAVRFYITALYPQTSVQAPFVLLR